jgi:hypothetical protein
MIEFIIMLGANTRPRRSACTRNAFAAAGFRAVASSPQEFAAAVRSELERNRKLIDSGAIKVD